MRTSLVTFPVIAALVLIGLNTLWPADSTRVSTQFEAASISNKVADKPLPVVTTVGMESTPPSLVTEHLHKENVANSAADFEQLPVEQQQEIKALSGRDSDAGKQYQTIEIRPGLVAVMADNGPQVVPVAVMNDDGTVSLHEY